MLKRIIIISTIYAIVIVATTLFLSQSEYFISINVVAGLIFGIFLVREVVKKYFLEEKPVDYNLEYSIINTDQLNKISQKPFLFGLEKKFISNLDFYFDENYFYAVTKGNQAAKFEIASISELSRTAVRINNSTIWKIMLTAGSNSLTFKFVPNGTLTNNNFKLFYDQITLQNPSAVKSEWSLWRS